MNLFEAALALSTLLCSLVAGFVFAFATVVMPGIGRWNDRDFLQAFKAMDRVIQDNQPLFMLVWVGSVVSLIGTTLLSLWWLNGTDRLLMILAAGIYLLGVQLPTATINVPLNNRLQQLDLETLPEPELSEPRKLFDSRWVRWNTIRTVLAILTSALLIVLLLRT